MKVLQINTLYNRGSTGRIVKGIEERCDQHNIEHFAAFRYCEKDLHLDKKCIPVSSWLDCHIHNRLAKYTGLQGWFSIFHTLLFICKINRICPDIIHLHNIHGSYINHFLLFSYIRRKKIEVVWTLHDCWAFTGGCPHFTYSGCNGWKNGCGDCKYRIEKKGLFDSSKSVLNSKKKLFSGLPAVTLVTPSKWMKNIVEQSFLKQYQITVVNNGINLSIFKPTESNFRSKYDLVHKFIVLGVSFEWNQKKGLDVFVKLSNILDERFKIVLVGIDADVKLDIPESIICISRTNNQNELAAIYSASDLFFNPTREDTYPTVNMEALACGTPVLTFDTGGSTEMIDEKCGYVVSDNIDAVVEAIENISEHNLFTRDECIKKAKSFSQNDRFEDYIDIYTKMNR